MEWLKMTKITTYRCDICEKEISSSYFLKTISGKTSDQSHLSLTRELCSQCYGKIRNFVMGLENE